MNKILNVLNKQRNKDLPNKVYNYLFNQERNLLNLF